MKKILSLLLVVAVLISVAPVNSVYAAVKINKTKATLKVDERLKLKVSGTKTTPKWTSSKKSVASVSKTGTVIAKAEGNATITATISDKKYACKIKVVKKHSDDYELFLKSVDETFTVEDGREIVVKRADGKAIYSRNAVVLLDSYEIGCVVEGVRTVDVPGYRRYIIVDFSIMNLSDVELMSDDSCLSLSDGNQYTYTPTKYTYDKNISPTGTLNVFIRPGDMARGEVAFDVPYNAPPIFTLRLDMPYDEIGGVKFSIDLSEIKNQYKDIASTIKQLDTE